MAKIISSKIMTQRAVKPNLGGQLLDIITSGMYNDPLMSVREYVQNAVDSIDLAISKKKLLLSDCRISIDVCGRTRTITITDNGAGVPNGLVEVYLGSLGFSQKESSTQRGFRGIGRLGGLAYCDKLIFETRSKKSELIASVEWDGKRLRELSRDKVEKGDLKALIHNIAVIRFRKALPEDPASFFRAQMINVVRFHRDVLMDLGSIRDYLSQVTPTPFSPDFSFSKQIEGYLGQAAKAYNIFLNGEQIYKPYKDVFKINSKKIDKIKDVEKILYQDSDGETLGVGWYATTSFSASLPKDTLMRGVRLRHGNIEVGGENSLEDIYTEKRFASWHIGEIHLNHNIKPNARRDGFEQNCDYEKFLEQVSVLGRKLSHFCRAASKKRGAKQRIQKIVIDLNNLLKKEVIFIDFEHFNITLEEGEGYLVEIRELIKQYNLSDTKDFNLIALEQEFNNFRNNPLLFDKYVDGRVLRNMSRKSLLKEFCKEILGVHEDSKNIKETVAKALSPFMKR